MRRTVLGSVTGKRQEMGILVFLLRKGQRARLWKLAGGSITPVAAVSSLVMVGASAAPPASSCCSARGGGVLESC
ncbi:unnamed protein product [Urochloa humidicola]